MNNNMYKPKLKTVRISLMEQQMLEEIIKVKEKKYNNEVKFTESEIIRQAIQEYYEDLIGLD